MKWIVEEDVFDEGYLEEMERVFLNRDIPYEIIKYVPFSDATYLPIVPDREAIVYGSINLLKQVGNYTKWKPGAGVNWNSYRYSSYFPWYNRYVYNRTPRWYPLNEMVKRADTLFATPKWVKSDSGDKIWSGGVYTKEEFLHEAEFVSSNHTPHVLMVIHEPSSVGFHIEKEWRIFCIQRDIITGSQYREYGLKKTDPEVPKEVLDFARKILDDVYYIPDPVFALDICIVRGQLFLLELSAFHCAGFYSCDIEKLIRSVHKYYSGKFFGLPTQDFRNYSY